MPKNHAQLTAARLRELLSYDPNTGIFCWQVSRGSGKRGLRAGRKNDEGYIEISIDSRFYKAHRLAWLYVHGCWPAEQMDHRNGVRTDNRIANLREATHAENQQNKAIHRNNTSGHPGVYWNKQSRKWQVQMRNAGRFLHLGYFDDFADAVAARVRAKAALHSPHPTERIQRTDP